MSKAHSIDMKKREIYQERRRRLINAGVPEEKVDQVIAREDYERLPVNEKISRLEQLIVRNSRALAEDIRALRANQTDLADSMDVNFESFAQMLAQLGLPAEKQREIVAATEQALKEKRERDEAERTRLVAEAANKAEQQAVADAVDSPPPETPAPTPDGATVFGT